MAGLLARRKIIVLAENSYEDLELWYPVLRFREEGADVVLAGTGPISYTGKHGYPVTVDCPNVADLSPDAFDAVIIPGGYAPDYLRRYPAVLRLVQKLSEQGKVVAAICHGAWVLVSAGLLKGRKATCYSSIKDDVINAGAEYRDAEVVRDGHLITSRQPDDLGAFCREILKALVQKREREEK